MKFIAYPFCFVIFLLIPLSAGADTVYLTDGSIITGQIKYVGTENLIVSTAIGEITVANEKVLRVDQATDAPQEPSPNSISSSYPDSHLRQKNGFGFGPGASSMVGALLFYDHNLSGKSQLHVQLNGNARSRSTIFDEEILKSKRSMILTTYRYFPAENNGFYIGGGGGYAKSTLTYTSSSWSTPYEYTAKLSGVFLLGEIGWQGKDGYYFNVGFQPAAYISSNDNYDVNNIPNTANHRVVANEDHDDLKMLSQLSLGFGWFF